jgi:hypothetical protein
MQIRQLLQVNPDSDVNSDTARTVGLPVESASGAEPRVNEVILRQKSLPFHVLEPLF